MNEKILKTNGSYSRLDDRLRYLNEAKEYFEEGKELIAGLSNNDWNRKFIDAYLHFQVSLRATENELKSKMGDLYR